MTERDFVYWFQGWLEMENPKSITGAKLQMIKDHLDLVFQHVAGVKAPDAKETPKEPEKSSPASSPISEEDAKRLLREIGPNNPWASRPKLIC